MYSDVCEYFCRSGCCVPSELNLMKTEIRKAPKAPVTVVETCETERVN